MSLPANIERCPGRRREVKPGEWPFPSLEQDCIDCARRREGIADYMAGAGVQWMTPPTPMLDGTICAERLAYKREAKK
jgi:hypothetical protein